MILVLVLSLALFVGGCYAYVRVQMSINNTSYTDTVENIILNMVPEEGIEVQGKWYDYWKVKSFLEEVRYDPYNYAHKEHHCILQNVPENDIVRVVSLLRVIMGVW